MKPSTRRNKQKLLKQHDLIQIKRRINVVIILFFFAQLALSWGILKTAYMASKEPATKVSDYLTKEIRRGNIYDANGNLLVTSLKVHSLYADPKMMLDVNDAVFKLKKEIPDIDVYSLKEKLSNKNRRFVWIKRNISPKLAYQINSLGIPGVYFKKEFFRTYPNGNLAAHILGYVNRNGKGAVGVEKAFDEKLANGEDIYLTIDSVLQNQLRDSLAKQIEKTKAKSAWGITINPQNGEVIASVSLPDYDPNTYNKATPAQWRNRIVSDVFEMGSVNKTFTYALGFEKNIIDLDSMLDATKPLRIGRYTIRDFAPKSRWLSSIEAFKYSSNIATGRIADEMTSEEQKKFLKLLNLLEPLTYDLGETTTPIIPSDKSWKRLKRITVSYGYGVATTPLQSVAALAAIGNSGNYIQPKFVKATQTEKKKVISDETAKKMKILFASTVEQGTGRRARVEGYLVGGKTGTAEIMSTPGEDNNLATFVGFAPLNNPKFITLIGVNSPQGKFTGGGSVAAPVFKEFAVKAFATLGIRPTVHKMQEKGNEILNNINKTTGSL